MAIETSASRTQALFDKYPHSLEVEIQDGARVIFKIKGADPNYVAFLDAVKFIKRNQKAIQGGNETRVTEACEFAFSFFHDFISSYLGPLKEVLGLAPDSDSYLEEIPLRDFPKNFRFIFSNKVIVAKTSEKTKISCTYVPVVYFSDFKPGYFQARAFLESLGGTELDGMMFNVLERILGGVYHFGPAGHRSPPGRSELKETPVISLESEYGVGRIYVAPPRSLLTVLRDLTLIPDVVDATSNVKFWQLVSNARKTEKEHARISNGLLGELYPQ